MKNDNDDDSNNKYGTSWGEIFENLYARLFRYALKFTNGNTYDAEGLVQDTFYRVMFYTDNPATIDNLPAYLATSLRNLWIDKLKKSKKTIIQSIDDPNNREALLNKMPSIEPTVLRDLENQDYQNEIRIALNNLKPLEKNVFILYLQGFNCEEIALKLGENIYLIKYVLNAVRAKIRYRINKQVKAAKR